MTIPQIITEQPAQPELQVGAGFQANPADPRIGTLTFAVGPAQFALMMPTANVVPFLRALADNVEKELKATPMLARPNSGLFLPG